MSRPAGFWARALASVIDGIVIYLVSFALTLAVLGTMYWVSLLSGSDSPGFGEAFTAVFIQWVFTWVSTPVWFAYYIVGHARYGTTVGKRALGLRVVNAPDGGNLSWRQSILRAFGYVISYLPFGAGFLTAAFNREKQALHDLITGTRVVHAGLLLLALAALAAPSTARALGKPVPQLGVSGLALEESRGGGEGVLGARVELATKWHPIPGRGITFGPRAGADLLFGSDVRGHTLSLGAESAIWIMNAIGMGVGLEYVLPLQDRPGPRNWWVLEPFLRVRLERLGVGGAFAFHASPVYETAYGFGWRVGFVVEFSGVFGL